MNRMLQTLMLMVTLVLWWAEVGLAADRPPNILFILVDDQSPEDLRCYNPESALQSPNIDRLAREGWSLTGRITWGRFRGRFARRRGT
jgi:choline-sulfatase